MSESILGSLKTHLNEQPKSSNPQTPTTQNPKATFITQKKTNMDQLYESLNIKINLKQKKKQNKLQEQVDRWIKETKCKQMKVSKLKRKDYNNFKELREFVEADKLKLTDLQILTLGCLLRHYQQDIDESIQEVRLNQNELEDVEIVESEDDLGLNQGSLGLGKRGGFEGMSCYGLIFRK
jgi:hypothetical protein